LVRVRTSGVRLEERLISTVNEDCARWRVMGMYKEPVEIKPLILATDRHVGRNALFVHCLE
jgi:hypothetical protein